MKVLVVSKPIYNYYIPLVDFPKNGDVYNIESTIESIYGQANVATYMLANYGLDVSYTGMIGKDEAGDKFKKILDDAHVDTRYVEVDYEEHTDKSYSIIKTEKNGFARIKVNSMKKDLTKYKYDFTPDFIVFDDKDFSGTNALLNNYPNVTSIFYGEKPTKDAINMCKRSKYVVCNIEFASKLTGIEIELNKPKTIVNLYQKLIDLYKCQWVITLGEYGVIYCNDMQVKMIPGIPTEVVDRDKAGSIFFGTFAYSIISGLDIEESVRLANINASASLKVIGAMNGFLDKETLLSYRVIKTETNSNPTMKATPTTNPVATPETNSVVNAEANPIVTPENSSVPTLKIGNPTNVSPSSENSVSVVNPNPQGDSQGNVNTTVNNQVQQANVQVNQNNNGVNTTNNVQ